MLNKTRFAALCASAAAALTACSGGAPEDPALANRTHAAAELASNAAEAIEEEPLPPVPLDPEAGPAGADQYSWTRLSSAGTDGSTVLLYGARGGGEMLINLQCRIPGRVTVLQMRGGVGEARGEPMALRSGTQQVRLDVTLGADSGDGTTPAAAELPIGHPLLAAFRSTGRLSVTNDGRTRVADAIDATERAAITDFFESCRATGQ